MHARYESPSERSHAGCCVTSMNPTVLCGSGKGELVQVLPQSVSAEEDDVVVLQPRPVWAGVRVRFKGTPSVAPLPIELSSVEVFGVHGVRCTAPGGVPEGELSPTVPLELFHDRAADAMASPAPASRVPDQSDEANDASVAVLDAGAEDDKEELPMCRVFGAPSSIVSSLLVPGEVITGTFSLLPNEVCLSANQRVCIASSCRSPARTRVRRVAPAVEDALLVGSGSCLHFEKRVRAGVFVINSSTPMSRAEKEGKEGEPHRMLGVFTPSEGLMSGTSEEVPVTADDNSCAAKTEDAALMTSGVLALVANSEVTQEKLETCVLEYMSTSAEVVVKCDAIHVEQVKTIISNGVTTAGGVSLDICSALGAHEGVVHDCEVVPETMPATLVVAAEDKYNLERSHGCNRKYGVRACSWDSINGTIAEPGMNIMPSRLTPQEWATFNGQQTLSLLPRSLVLERMGICSARLGIEICAALMTAEYSTTSCLKEKHSRNDANVMLLVTQTAQTRRDSVGFATVGGGDLTQAVVRY